MNKWERQVRLTVAAAGAKVVDRQPNSNGHLRLVIQLPTGASHKVVVSSSPAVKEHALAAIKRDVLQLIDPTAPKGTP